VPITACMVDIRRDVEEACAGHVDLCHSGQYPVIPVRVRPYIAKRPFYEHGRHRISAVDCLNDVGHALCDLWTVSNA
jgi:hypothetical protein